MLPITPNLQNKTVVFHQYGTIKLPKIVSDSLTSIIRLGTLFKVLTTFILLSTYLEQGETLPSINIIIAN